MGDVQATARGTHGALLALLVHGIRCSGRGDPTQVRYKCCWQKSDARRSRGPLRTRIGRKSNSLDRLARVDLQQAQTDPGRANAAGSEGEAERAGEAVVGRGALGSGTSGTGGTGGS